MILAAGMIWAIIAYQYAVASIPHEVDEAVRHFLTEFAELFLFLLTAMTYVNAMSQRRVFAALRSWLVNRWYSYPKLSGLPASSPFSSRRSSTTSRQPW